MLSKKVFLAGEPNFSAPPVHATRADVRDHVESQEGDHRASYASDRGLQRRRQANTVFREISGAAQFSTFSTASTRSGHSRSDQVGTGKFLGWLSTQKKIIRTSRSGTRAIGRTTSSRVRTPAGTGGAGSTSAPTGNCSGLARSYPLC